MMIIGVIYRHHNMDAKNFIDEILNTLVHKLSFEKNKKIFIAGDFNFDLKFKHTETSVFFNKMTLTFYCQ